MVKKLVEPLKGNHYHIYFDNYFSSVKLFEDLLDDQLYVCGTFRKDRKRIPEDIKSTKIGTILRALQHFCFTKPDTLSV